MKLALSTNWCNRRIEDGREIADKAIELGFRALELGYHTTPEQVEGILTRADQITVESVHAFCPVPISAPYGYPELYSLASFSKSDRALARAFIVKNIEFTSSVGAKTLVLHAGKVGFSGIFRQRSSATLAKLFSEESNKYKKELMKSLSIRRKNGGKMLEIFKRELETLLAILEEKNVTLAFENLPYLEGFPNEEETINIVEHFKSDFIRGWFDTGHDKIRTSYGWIDGKLPKAEHFVGMHINDVKDLVDEHLPPGQGNVDFKALKQFVSEVRHVVFEPSSSITENDLKKGIMYYERELQS